MRVLITRFLSGRVGKKFPIEQAVTDFFPTRPDKKRVAQNLAPSSMKINQLDIIFMTDNVLKLQAFKLKGRLCTLTVLSVLDTDEANFTEYLNEVISKAPRLFSKTPIVLDFSEVDHTLICLQSFCRQLREQGLIPVAVQSASQALQTEALAAGLAVLGASSSQDKELMEEDSESKVQSSETITSKLISSQVRSGQQVVSKGGDLVIVSSVSHGAELLADGNIHVYGALRGRALAGIAGNKHARIFCQSLDAELVSIAGFYRLRDAIVPPSGPCQIYLQNDHIQIESL